MLSAHVVVRAGAGANIGKIYMYMLLGIVRVQYRNRKLKTK